MKPIGLLFVCVTVMLVSTSAFGQIHFVANLSGAQENPAVATPATGTGSFTLSDDFSEIRYVITYQRLSGTLTAGGHFHVAGTGINGPVVKSIASSGDPASATITGTWKSTDIAQPLTSALVESLLTGRMYVNFHTAAHPGGEMRGQLNLATAVMFRVDLDGTQEAPPVGTSANGTGRVILKPGFSELDYEFAYQGLSGPLSAGGHFHFGALGEPGPVVKTIAFSGDSSSNIVQGEWKATDPSGPLTSAVIDSLIAGKLYVNFHTTAHPGGEIRGQLKMAGGTAFGAMLQGSNEVPANASDGKGVGYFILNGLRTELRYAVTYFKLTGPLTAGGHFHVGGNGKNGPVVKGIATGGMAASATVSGTWSTTDATNPLTPALVESLFTKRVYVNFHTAANPGGEIRSQLDLLSGYGFTVLLDGAQEVPPSGSAAQGSGSVVLSPGADSVQYSVTYYGLSGTLTAGGHFHIGSPGKLGPVVKSIAFLGGAASSTYQGTWSPFDATQPLNNHYF